MLKEKYQQIEGTADQVSLTIHHPSHLQNGRVSHVLGYTMPSRRPLSNQTEDEMIFPFHGKNICVGFLPMSTGSATRKGRHSLYPLHMIMPV